ncbi:hypothetical protein CQA57_04165 [Helicobacter anseris]|uniref:Capsule biosynthesis protein n=1 Tax=Helicobacter anseris TaxID=375926 RepID=A0A3D8J8N5_9HELI|nr:hypothetical protein [Helicobacter anseris]RDU73867.1 hypothetical protein CQA57_04165 [Helicobacter anseris]
MKKNIFILDCSENGIFKNFIKNAHFNVIGCIVFNKNEKEYCLQHGIKYVFTSEEIDFLSELDLFNFSLIEDYRPTQRKVEFGMMRSLNSNMLIANKYYNALCLFEKIFKDNKIDCIFTNCIPHGYIPETILLDMGRKYQIPTYCIFPVTMQYSCIIRYDTKKNVQVSNPIAKEEVTQDVFNKNKNSYQVENINHKLPKRIQKIFHNIGGQITIDILSCLKRLNPRIQMGFYQTRLIEKIYSLYRLGEMKRFYKKNSVIPDYTQKYIFYAIHFEPEAATGVICDLQNQLTIIQLLAKSLPDGWLLYIKDHPHQYNINNILDHYYLTNIHFFKDRDFYEEVLKIKNVRLITLQTQSEDLLQHAQAVATINGSIILESVTKNKACITFDNYLMPITQSKLFSNIHVFQNLQRLKEYFTSSKYQQKMSNEEIDSGIEKLRYYYFNHHIMGGGDLTIMETIIKDLKNESNA